MFSVKAAASAIVLSAALMAPPSPVHAVEATDHGVFCDGRDDTQALNTLFREFSGKAIHLPEGGNCYATDTLLVGQGTTVYSDASPLQNHPGIGWTGAATITCATREGVACVAATSHSAVTGAIMFRGLGIAGATWPPAPGSIGLLIADTSGPVLENVMVYNFAKGIKIKATGPAGISARFDNVETCKITEDDLIIDSWPETRINKTRFGCNSDGTFRKGAYIAVVGGGPGPNTLYVDNSHFNAGNGGARCFVWFRGLGQGQRSGLVSEFVFTGNHFESGFSNESAFCSDPTVEVINGLMLTDNKFLSSGVGNHFWQLDPKTESWYWVIGENHFAGWRSFYLAPGGPFRNLSLCCGNIFQNTPVYINAPQWSVVLAGPNIYEGLTIVGDYYAGSFSGINLGTVYNYAVGNVRTDF